MTQEQPVHFHPHALPVRRREVLRLMAASMALAGAGCTRQPRERIYPWVDMPEARADSSPVFYASAVARDGHAQGVLIATHGGRPTKVEGNPLHPSSLGATDAFGQATVLDLWDPDRSQAPMQRLGREHEGPLAISSWPAFETAWRRVANDLDASGGEGLRLLAGPATSPTLRRQLAAIARRWPRSRLHQYSSVPDAGARAGTAAAFGREVQPLFHFDRVRCVLSLAADPFSEGPGAVRHAMDWSQLRSREGPQAACAVEVAPGLFGARADRRVAMAPRDIEALALRLAAGQPLPGLGTEMLAALRAAGRDALVIAGPSLSASAHAAVHALNDRLGAAGNTVQYLPPLAWAEGAGNLPGLVSDMEAGRVRVLLVLDANPAYDTPGELGFRQAVSRVATSVHCGLYRDESARTCDWHLPLSHGFEAWSDALAHDGTATLVQPAIAPLYDSRSLHELLALVAGDDVRDGHAIVQATWREQAGGGFDTFWREALQKGVIEGSAPAPLRVRARAEPASTAGVAGGAGLVAVFAPDPSAHDGRFANNAWLQELPRPFTKLTWDNAALLGPATARQLGLRKGDRVRLRAGTRSVAAPVWVQDGHAEGVLTLPLGYGRDNAGRVGDGVGFDAYHLMAAQAGPLPVQVERLADRHDFAVTQHTMDPSGREPARVIDAGARVEPEREQPSLYPRWEYPEHAWAMTIDLDACIGCNACTAACQAENNIPVVGKEQVSHGREMHWIRVDAYAAPEEDETVFQPVPCMHCENAPCELVCPVGATMHDSEGLNVQVYNRCIGTRFCSNNCPYKVRRFNFLQFTDATTESLKGQRNPNVTVRQRGVMEKCNYCLQRVARARQHAQRTGVPLADGDVVTACQAVCPTRAIHFGDLHDPASAVSQQRRSPRHYALLAELNTRPRTTYLARVRRKEEKGPKT
ncbi:4Fe-4S dicluster domain-containing protein [Ramlibacter humi]|uniref:4Fe-4S dicluster domain-containing protein n=1 Tax=Ramlibacter humi TaxID=2530451 RepID=A0A4Z0BD21_9BURK|nr:4Fe-4S dicluster domain-containing protein [Ramlibacter humi]TFY97195.1 4Fe-4S dicluster domain-containing protein [Ramlibacter humi]